MPVRPGTTSDLDWMVSALGERRASLVDFAPTFWRPASDALGRHRAFLEQLLVEGGAKAYRTDSSVLLAARRGDGWLIDDLHVPDGQWERDGLHLWNSFAFDAEGDGVRFVCPTYEENRRSFAEDVGLQLAETWWLIELDSSGGEAGAKVSLPGAEAVTVPAPPVYAPPGPMLFLPALTDAVPAVSAAPPTAEQLGCAGVVVNQAAGDFALAEALSESGFRRHCDYFTGTIRRI